MARFVEARDPYSGAHLWRVSRYARRVAERAGLGRATDLEPELDIELVAHTVRQTVAALPAEFIATLASNPPTAGAAP